MNRMHNFSLRWNEKRKEKRRRKRNRNIKEAWSPERERENYVVFKTEVDWIVRFAKQEWKNVLEKG